MTNTYLGKSREEYLSILDYDTEEGKLYHRKNGKEIGSISPQGLLWKVREGRKVLSISVGKLCYFLSRDIELLPKHKIRYVDGNCYNLRPDNLELKVYIPPQEENDRLAVVEVGDHLYYNPNTHYFVVRRSENQSVYRTFDLKEAISIRDEWKNNKTIVRHDRFMKKVMENLVSR